MEKETVKAELTIVDPKEFGLEAKNATSIESAFKPKMIDRDSFSEQYETIIKQELNADTFKQARELRLKLVKVRTGISDVHKTEKAFYLASGKYVDALKNKLTLPIEQMEEKLMEIEKYEARIEAERIAKLKQERIEKLLPFGTDTTFIQLDQMSDEQFEQLLSREEMAYNAKIEAEKKAEQERIEAEKKSEAERLERERLEAERIEAQRLENERLKAEQEYQAKQIHKQTELFNLGFKSTQTHFVYNENIQIKVGDLHEMSMPNFFKYLESSKNEISVELEKLAKEQAIKDEAAKKESERLAKIAAEEKAKSDKLAAELKAKEDAEKLAHEQEKARIEAEESERLAKEKALKNADDQTKVKAFYELFKSVEFPELNSDTGKAMSKDINSRMAELKKQIILQAKGLL